MIPQQSPPFSFFPAKVCCPWAFMNSTIGGEEPSNSQKTKKSTFAFVLKQQDTGKKKLDGGNASKGSTLVYRPKVMDRILGKDPNNQIEGNVDAHVGQNRTIGQEFMNLKAINGFSSLVPSVSHVSNSISTKWGDRVDDDEDDGTGGEKNPNEGSSHNPVVLNQINTAIQYAESQDYANEQFQLVLSKSQQKRLKQKAKMAQLTMTYPIRSRKPNLSQLDSWSDSSCLALPKCCFDHNPLIFVADNASIAGPKPFRFCNVWTSHPTFKQDGLSELFSKMRSKPVFLDGHTLCATVELGNFQISKFRISYGFKITKILESLVLAMSCLKFEGLRLVEVLNAPRGRNVFTNSTFHNTIVMFANCIYFNGTWKGKCDALRTIKYDFFQVNKTAIRVPYMTRLPYGQWKDQRRFYLYIFLPYAQDGLSELFNKMRSKPGFYDGHILCAKTKVGNFQISKFRISYGFKITKILMSLVLAMSCSKFEGLRLVKVLNAPMGRNVSTESIFHKCVFDFNQGGTEVAVASLSMICISSQDGKDGLCGESSLLLFN
ncbi:hypothetical protein L1049_018031 [Liquidambar formosana]|uniref:Serpin domain-containing protein n=1 Tax=Liquidambar formosana TaxID=63359 RepID=A0AAP0R8W2_LIQFO